VIALSILVATVAGILLLPTVSDLISLFYLAARGRTAGERSPAVSVTDDRSSRLLFLVAAHNEEAIIDRCLESLLAMDCPRESFTVLVVADNCTDRTAELAQRAGVTCLERNAPDEPGKPYAIRWALEELDCQAYDALVIVDADTRVDSGLAAALASHAPLRWKGVQSYNGVSNPTENALTYLASILSEAYYEFMYPLKEMAGLNVPLTGAGMCVGTGNLGSEGWGALSLSEDVEMYARLTLDGVPTEVAPEARTYSEEANNIRAGVSQRKRWRAGRLEVLRHLGLRIALARSLATRQRLDLLAELAAPGPALHLALSLTLALASLGLSLPATPWLVTALLASLVRPGVYVVLAVRSLGEPARALRAFAYLPVYASWRLLVELRMWLGFWRSQGWVRTQRNRPTP
jgi:cellulose synthase/poly-beta-1,6-N-acetylglucosamine synthase-like glycosyltransferase